MKVGIVILNYLVYQDTIEFVKTIKQQNQENVELKIIIVDNDSSNESLAVLRETYREDAQIKIVAAEKNLGFAGGNNLGYLALCEEMDLDYVIIANDDILLLEQGLFDWIACEDKKYQFAVLGPKVYSLHGNYHQSPMQTYTQDLQECKRNLMKLRWMLCEMFVKNSIKKILKRDDKNFLITKWVEQAYQKRSTQVTLHGAFLVFSRRYLEVFSLPFDPQTFLYMEEHILRLRCQKENIVMLYSPDYRVEHRQATATQQQSKSRLDLRYFQTKHKIHSLKRYIALLEEYDKALRAEDDAIKEINMC